MAQNFNKSLYLLEEQKKVSMRRQSVTQQNRRLPPIDKPQTNQGERAKTIRPITSRPMTAVTVSSVPSSTRL